MGDAKFREGFAQLAPLGLTFDAWLFESQIGALVALARDFPDQPIVLDHTGAPLGIGYYADKRDGSLRKLEAGHSGAGAMSQRHGQIGRAGDADQWLPLIPPRPARDVQSNSQTNGGPGSKPA